MLRHAVCLGTAVPQWLNHTTIPKKFLPSHFSCHQARCCHLSMDGCLVLVYSKVFILNFLLGWLCPQGCRLPSLPCLWNSLSSTTPCFSLWEHLTLPSKEKQREYARGSSGVRMWFFVRRILGMRRVFSVL